MNWEPFFKLAYPIDNAKITSAALDDSAATEFHPAEFRGRESCGDRRSGAGRKFAQEIGSPLIEHARCGFLDDVENAIDLFRAADDGIEGVIEVTRIKNLAL